MEGTGRPTRNWPAPHYRADVANLRPPTRPPVRPVGGRSPLRQGTGPGPLSEAALPAAPVRSDPIRSGDGAPPTTDRPDRYGRRTGPPPTTERFGPVGRRSGAEWFLRKEP